MAHFLCHLGCSHFGALLLDFYFTENTYLGASSRVLCVLTVGKITKLTLFIDIYKYENTKQSRSSAHSGGTD